MFLSSPGNSVNDHCSLLAQLDCQTFLGELPLPPVVQSIQATRPMRLVELPTLDFWLGDGKIPIYPFKKSFSEARLDPVVALHSSGTTGTPKLIIPKHGSYSTLDSFQLVPLLHGQPCQPHDWRGKRVFVSFGWYHGAGLLPLLYMAIYYDYISVSVPAAAKITPEIVNDVHAYGSVDISLLAPSILMSIWRNPSWLDQLNYLKLVTYTGGPLPPAAGAAISTKTRLTHLFGSTETGLMAAEDVGTEDWQYFKFTPFLNFEFRPFEDGVFELVMKRDSRFVAFQGVFHTFPDLQEFSMKDLFIRHPTKEGLWRSYGRTDNVIVFTDARKLNPAAMEAVLESHHAIEAALLCGDAKPQAALLVEPVTYPSTDTERDSLMCDVWEAAEQAMQVGPTSGKLSRDLVMITAPQKPLKRAGKGTVQRVKSLDLYQEDIEKLFADFEKSH